MNPLNEYPQARKWLYFVQWIVNGVLAVAAAIFLARQTPLADLPDWYVLALAIGPVLWTYLGLTAQANTSTGPVVVQGTVVDPSTGGTAEITATVERAADEHPSTPVDNAVDDDEPGQHRRDV